MARAERPAHKKNRCTKLPSNVKLDPMIEDAIVGANGESEQMTGFYTMLDDNLAVPFQTVMLDAEVTLERVDMTKVIRHALWPRHRLRFLINHTEFWLPWYMIRRPERLREIRGRAEMALS